MQRPGNNMKKSPQSPTTAYSSEDKSLWLGRQWKNRELSLEATWPLLGQAGENTLPVWCLPSHPWHGFYKAGGIMRRQLSFPAVTRAMFAEKNMYLAQEIKKALSFKKIITKREETPKIQGYPYTWKDSIQADRTSLVSWPPFERKYSNKVFLDCDWSWPQLPRHCPQAGWTGW